MELLRCWKNYEENGKTVTEWMATAEKLLNEPNLQTKQAVQANKVSLKVCFLYLCHDQTIVS